MAEDESPPLLSSLHDQKYTSLGYTRLVNISFSELYDVTEDQCTNLELVTRGHAVSHLWFNHRAYGLTGSYMHSICHANPNNPSLSLLFKVCSPADHCFKSKQTHWGCEHESKVIQDNELLIAPKHVNLKVEHSCVFLSKVTFHIWVQRQVFWFTVHAVGMVLAK